MRPSCEPGGGLAGGPTPCWPGLARTLGLQVTSRTVQGVVLTSLHGPVPAGLDFICPRLLSAHLLS